MVVGDDVAVLRVDYAAARAANDLLATPEAVAGGDHLLGGDLHHAGGNGVDHAHQRIQRSGAAGAAGGGAGGIGALIYDAGAAGLIGQIEARVATAEAHACNQHQSQRTCADFLQVGVPLFHAGRLGLAAHGGGGATGHCVAGGGVVGAGAHGGLAAGADGGVGSRGGIAAAAARIGTGIIIFPFVFHVYHPFR